MAFAVAAGLAFARIPEPGVAALAATLALGLMSAAVRPAFAIAGCSLLLLSAAAGHARLDAIDSDPLSAVASGSQIELRGNLLEHPRSRAFGSSMRVRVVAPGGRGQLVEVRTNAQTMNGEAIGDEIVAYGKLSAVDPEAGSPRAASYARYLLRNGVRRRFQAESVALTGARRSGLPGAIDAIRERSERTLATGLAAEPAALLRGMVLGGDNGIPEPTAEAFRVAGLSHILAVSGQNVLLLVILVEAIAMAAGVGRQVRLMAGAALICVYVPLCGAQASVVRAGAMGLAGLAAMLASRPSSRVYALLLAAIAVLGWNPRATADVGAQLSFAAVLGIMAFTRPLAERLSSRVPRWAAEAFAATAGATVATAPLMAYHFSAVSLVSLAANVLAAPLIGPIVWLGSLAAAIGQFSLPLGALLNAPNGFLLGSLITVARIAAAVPGAQAGLPKFGAGWLIAAFVPVGLAALVANGLLPSSITRPARKALRRIPKPNAPVMVAVAIVAFALLLAHRDAGPIMLPRTSVLMLDVGQGDATLVLGGSRCEALIDGGPPGRNLRARLVRLGVSKLELVVATHPQLDHDGGIGEIAAAGSPAVDTFLDGGGNTVEPRFIELRRRFRERAVRSVPATAGTRWSCGDLRVSVLAPAPQAPGASPPSDPNTRAAVTLVEAAGLRVLASGDAESPQLLPLALPVADVLKLPHHGSSDPGLPAVLARVAPRVALIGVGAENRYGHPTRQAIAALGAAGVSIYRTDKDGSIAIGLGGANQPENAFHVYRHVERRR